MLIGSQSPLIFTHIPKTGGMSLFTAFCGLFGTRIADLYNLSSSDPERAGPYCADRSLALYCGHFPFGLHEWLDRPAYYLACLREPVARLISLYHYCLPMFEKMRQRMRHGGLRAEALFINGRNPDYYRDFIPCLEGSPDPDTFFACPSAELDNGMVRRLSGVGLTPGPCPESALELAKANINRHYGAVGLLERYPETLSLIQARFGLIALNENKVNVNVRKDDGPKISSATLARLRALNALDIELYAWVSDRFDAQLRQPGRATPIPGGGRVDHAHIPLWLAVGQSPLRDAAMRLGGVPRVTSAPVRFYVA